MIYIILPRLHPFRFYVFQYLLVEVFLIDSWIFVSISFLVHVLFIVSFLNLTYYALYFINSWILIWNLYCNFHISSYIRVILSYLFATSHIPTSFIDSWITMHSSSLSLSFSTSYWLLIIFYFLVHYPSYFSLHYYEHLYLACCLHGYLYLYINNHNNINNNKKIIITNTNTYTQ